jgi:hypothetical protein
MSTPAKPIINELPLAEDQQLSFDWDDQAGVLNYYIYDSPATLLATIPGSASITTVTGLTNGQTYNAYIVASNANGVSDPAYFRPFQPGLAPTIAPLTATATKVGDSNALIQWTPSGESLVAPIQWYIIEAISDDPAASNFQYTADGLKPETSYYATGFNPYAYTFSVQAANCPGYGPAAITNSISFVINGSWLLGEPTSAGNQILNATTTFGFSPGTSNFTIEFFLRVTNYGPNNSFTIRLGNFASIVHDDTGNGGGLIVLADGAVVNGYTNTKFGNSWTHVAIPRQGNVYGFFTGGDRRMVNTNAGGDYTASGTEFLFIDSTANTTDLLITNLRFIQNATAYNPSGTNIVVPTAPLTATPETLALYLAGSDEPFADSTGNKITSLTQANGISWNSNTPVV